MARYIDADELLTRLPDDLPYKASVKRVLTIATTADVAPKTEIAREIIDEIETAMINCEDWSYIPVAVAYTLCKLKKKYPEVKR